MNETTPKTREYFVEHIEPGNMVAFNTSTCMASGRVIEISPTSITVQTLNGSIFFIPKSDIVWVKQGTRWPLGIYNALRYPRKSRPTPPSP